MDWLLDRCEMTNIAAESYLITAISVLIFLLILYLLLEGFKNLIPDWNLRLVVSILLFATLMFIFSTIVVRYCDYGRNRDEINYLRGNINFMQ